MSKNNSKIKELAAKKNIWLLIYFSPKLLLHAKKVLLILIIFFFEKKIVEYDCQKFFGKYFYNIVWNSAQLQDELIFPKRLSSSPRSNKFRRLCCVVKEYSSASAFLALKKIIRVHKCFNAQQTQRFDEKKLDKLRHTTV